MNLTHRPARGSGSFEFAWKIVLTSLTYDMFSLLILSSLLAVLLTKISILQHRSERFRFSGPRIPTRIDWRTARSCQLASWRMDCFFAAMYKAGAPPGLHTVMLAEVPRVFEQSSDNVTRSSFEQSTLTN